MRSVGITLGSLESFMQMNVVLSLRQQLINAGYTDKTLLNKPTEGDINQIMKIPSLQELVRMLNKAYNIEGKSPFFKNESMFNTKGRAHGWKILLDLSANKNVLELSYTMGHEINHSITDVFLPTFKDIVGTNGMVTAAAFFYYSEYRSYSWEISEGNHTGTNAWDLTYQKHGPHPEIEAKLKELKIPSPYYSPGAVDMVKRHLNNLDQAYKIFYNNLKK